MKLNKLSIAMGLMLSTTLVLTGCGGAEDGDTGAQGLAGDDASTQVVSLEQVGRTASQGFAVSASEIVAYDKANNRIYTVNARSGQVDVFNNLGASVSTSPSQSLDMATLINGFAGFSTATVGEANSIAVSGNYAAVAVANATKTNNGWVVILNTGDFSVASVIETGALPDMVTFTPDGKKVLVANEGEPEDNYLVDPEGSVSVITLANFSKVDIGFADFNIDGTRNAELDLTKMVLDGYSATNVGNKATVAQSFEPEYITVSEDGSKAFVALQENNAIAVINLADNSIEKIFGLGFKDHSIPGNEMDASQKDGVNIKNWPVMGMYMPDSISSMTYNGKTYLLTANEGDSREDWLNAVTDSTSCTAAGYYFDGKCLDELALKDIGDSDLIMGAALTGLDTDTTLGRLKFSYFQTKVMNNGTTINKLYAYGGRSFSIWDTETGQQVFDSGSFFETKTAQLYGEDFNNDNAENTGDDRSDNKGPEPEAITVGKIDGHTYAFIGLERMGGVMTYDISNPYAPKYVQYVNNRDLTKSPAGTDTTYTVDAGDLGPEGFKFVPAADSPDNKNYLIVGNEVSGTTAVFEVKATLLKD
ncbi:choice-of-anchor I family protein [Thiomicrorhabdus aquaedulcis]|uniref:choice-of-anchor I family protein n=1 Tax=Thiomicrorhabdus aquaedulcis TaxID=2211106 RepID=UPI000FDB9F93|nr:choice-of-anchor I family protein [Thiomicrorhabdus aquaedulcis]